MKLTRAILLALAFAIPTTATLAQAQDKPPATETAPAEPKKAKKAKKAKKTDEEKKAPEAEKPAPEKK
jgi:hypothetical protein